MNRDAKTSRYIMNLVRPSDMFTSVNLEDTRSQFRGRLSRPASLLLVGEIIQPHADGLVLKVVEIGRLRTPVQHVQLSPVDLTSIES
jgi:hypothetical protein